MDLEIYYVPPSEICEGCLSVDRKLTPALDDNRIIFSEIINPLNPVNHPPSLCWECLAIIRKILKFKKKAKTAQDILVAYMLQENTQVSSLSTLSYKNIELVIYDKEVIPNSSTHLLKSNNIQTLTEVKIEKKEDDVDFGLDEMYDDEISNQHEEKNIATKDLKTVSAPCFFEYNTTLLKSRNKAKSNNIKNKCDVEDFNESDDEPLTAKKARKSESNNFYKPRQRRKKKEKADSEEKKSSSSKREKPPGVINNPRVARKLQQLNVSSGQLEMVALSWEEVEAERQKALSSTNFTRHQYRCYNCIIGFNHKFKLENHMKKHDPSCGAVTCSVCRVVCRDEHALCAHRRRHRVRWRCCACGETWSRAAVAADHYARAHRALAPTHTCTTCGHTEPTLGKLRNHIKNHSERQKCELCGKTFRDRTALRTHLFIHKGEKEYACPRCDKRFLFKKAMEIHLVTHDAHAHLYCHQCDVNFKNRMSYYQHMRYNLKHIDPAKLKYACQLCDKKFAKGSRLEEHNIAVHLKTTPITCTIPGCKFACSSRPVLRTHIRMVHRNQRAKRNHVCDTCGKAYTTKKILEGHMRSHTGERPFQCKHCPSTFGYEAALYNHNKLVHLKVKRRAMQPVAAAVTDAPAVPGEPTAVAASTEPTRPVWAVLSIAHPTQTHQDNVS